MFGWLKRRKTQDVALNDQLEMQRAVLVRTLGLMRAYALWRQYYQLPDPKHLRSSLVVEPDASGLIREIDWLHASLDTGYFVNRTDEKS